ncbi:HD domain-containing protein [Thermococcus prieurii]
MPRFYEIRDPIYGTIKLTKLERAIIDSEPFQRLRRIKQLSLTNFVYPGANHTRFEHSIGVMHLATLMFDAIIQDEENMKLLKDYEYIDNDGDIQRYRQVIRLAALLHDIGHGPFSHSAEELLPNGHKHEDYSAKIIDTFFDKILANNELNEFEITAEEISSLLKKGDPQGIRKGEYFWKLLISSQLDADRGDYLLRDSYYTGVKYGIYDYHRILESMTIAKNKMEGNDDLIIAIKKGGWHAAESLLLSRYLMYTQVYFHKTRLAYNYHIQEALKFVLKQETGENTFPQPKSKQELEEFLHWDDYYAWVKFREYKKQCPHCAAIVDRNHFRLVYSTMETPNDSDLELIEKIETKLQERNIKYFKYSGSRGWYKQERGEEIYIMGMKKDELYPLSMYSPLVLKLSELHFQKINIYVDPNYVTAAKNIVSDITKRQKEKS